MDGDADFLTVERAGADGVTHLGVDRRAAREVRWPFEPEQTWQRATEAAGVQYELGPMRLVVAVLVARGDGLLAVRGIDAGALDLLAHFGALALGFVDQELVEFGNLLLVGETVTGREFRS